MKSNRDLGIVSLCAGAALAACAPGAAKSPAEPTVVNDTIAEVSDRFEVAHGWPVLPDGHVLGQATGVAVDSHNHVFVFHRAGREWTAEFPKEPIAVPTVIAFDGSTGETTAEWGEGIFIMPHGLEVDGEDNIWVTDVGLHQVFKFSHDGKLLLTLGVARESGADASHFNLPTDVAAVPTGVYISDGYGNARVVKYSSAGAFEFEWGTPGKGPGQFALPHGIDVDEKGNVYVADRSNRRVQVFDAKGNYLSEWKSAALGRPFAVSIGADGFAYVIDGGDPPLKRPARSRVAKLGLDGAISGSFGRYGNYDGQFLMGHDIAAASDAIYVVDAQGKRVQKFVVPQPK